MPVEIDVLNPLEQAIEEFHRLREDSRRLMEQARWPEVKDSSQEAPFPDPASPSKIPLR